MIASALMMEQTITARASRARQRGSPCGCRLGGLWVLIAVSALAVLPPFLYLIQDSLMVPLPGFKDHAGSGKLSAGARHQWLAVVGDDACLRAGLVRAGDPAWIHFRLAVGAHQCAVSSDRVLGAFLSLAAPLIVKASAGFCLLGPNMA